ncbi:hypothetical protein KFE25_006075 [Diacronema lutheri]|uniref:Protein kinase domain-containing protein n=1 Tax=Diacronema lutheri TaxID=2081491 RepID=A0A8J5XX89_DIALT|nr:hypothetical protein KFE25_006075 [Diacronema lutheri]
MSAKPVKAKMVRQYMMGEMLGEGSYGKVREAIDSTTLRRVAVKIVDKRRLRRLRGAEEQQRREIAVQRMLKHEGIVELIEVIALEEKPDKMYIVLELVTGGSLQDLLGSYPDGRLPLALCHRFFAQLLRALGYCHTRGVIHRDIKPANLMLTADGQLKISDFGSAEKLDYYDETDTLHKSAGTPAFHPPEVASGCTDLSGSKTDVWAAGVTLFLIVTGSVPFSGTSLINLYDNIAAGEYIEPPVLAEQPALAELVRGLLATDPAERMTIDAALAHRWLTEPDAQWAEEAESAIAEIAARTRAVKSTVLAYIAKKLEDEQAAAEAAAAEAAAAAAAGEAAAAAEGTSAEAAAAHEARQAADEVREAAERARAASEAAAARAPPPPSAALVAADRARVPMSLGRVPVSLGHGAARGHGALSTELQAGWMLHSLSLRRGSSTEDAGLLAASGHGPQGSAAAAAIAAAHVARTRGSDALSAGTGAAPSRAMAVAGAPAVAPGAAPAQPPARPKPRVPQSMGAMQLRALFAAPPDGEPTLAPAPRRTLLAASGAGAPAAADGAAAGPEM